MTHEWNTPSICSYLCVSNAALVSGDVSFGSRYEIKYRRTWWWVKKLDEMMIEPIFVFCRITWNWWCWLPPGSDVTPKYLIFLVDFNCCIVRLIISLEEGICIVFSVVYLLMYGSPLSANSQVIRYYAHFVSARAPPEVWSICSQLLAAICKLSHIVVSEFSFKS